MESDLQHNHHFLHDHRLQHPQKQLNSGLTRYQSAPSSYFSSFLDRDFCEDFLNRPTSPETERIFARFLSNANSGNAENILEQNLEIIRENSPVTEKLMESEQKPQIIPPPMNNQSGIIQQQQQRQQRNYSSASLNYYPDQQQQNLQSQSSDSEMVYRTMSLIGMDRFSQMKMSGSGGNNSNLTRHCSSPAGLFNNVNIENGYVAMKGMGDFGTGNNTNREASSFSTPGRPPTSSKPMSPISEIVNKTNNAGFSETHSNNFSSGFPIDSWDESSMMSENIKRLREDDGTLSGLSASKTQNVDAGNRPLPPLSHHLSLPKDITSIEKLLQFQDSVPCKIRAKRGCATHPRSIAERVRRTKISERMRKLQELVPNMDKQTNTADMLDLAVDYVKELQKQVKALSDNRSKCTCSKEQRP